MRITMTVTVPLRILILPLVTSEGARRLGGKQSPLPYAFTMEELSGVVDGIRTNGFSPELLAAEPLPPESYHSGRRQYQCTPLIRYARKKLETMHVLSGRILIITDADLYEAGLNFTGGIAVMGGKEAIVSFARLQSGDRNKMIHRAVKECLHELGHTLSIEHCRDRNCVMFLSRSMADSDIKDASFCLKCRALIGRAMR